MSMYGDRNVNNEALKKWANTLSLNNITHIDIGGESVVLNSEMKKVLNTQLESFRYLVNKLQPKEDWRETLCIVSDLFYNAFFRHKNHAIHIANYFEAFVVPSNMKTYKKIVKGFDFLKYGAVQIYHTEKLIAEISLKSDLIWSVFYDFFINTYDSGDITHTHLNHEKYMTIKLYDVDGLSSEEINSLIQKMLLHISINHDLDFNIVDLDPIYKLEGEDTVYKSEFNASDYEYIPSLYLNNALHTLDTRQSYLSYYHVFEYFFVRIQNICFLNDMASFTTDNIDHNALRKILKKHKNSTNERESLKLVLQNSINIQNLKSWIQQEASRATTYCHSSENAIDLSKSDDKIISALSERIYKFRCSIAHAKGDVDEFIAVPTISESDISKELDIMKYLAYEVLKACSNI